jgi:ribosomal subunit interface protein
MQINITAKNFELTDSLRSVVEKKMSSLERLVIDQAELFVEIEKESKHHRKGDVFRAEAIITVPDHKAMGRAHGENLLTCITDVKKELERELIKYKGKKIEIPRRESRKSGKENRQAL